MRIAACVLLSVVVASISYGDRSEDVHWATFVGDSSALEDRDLWEDVGAIRDFYALRDHRTVSRRTKVQIAFDCDRLLLRAEMEDSDVMTSVLHDDGSLWEGDVIEFFFKPSVEAAGYYEFQVNPAGNILDMFIHERRPDAFKRWAKEIDFDLSASVSLEGTLNDDADSDSGWTVELTIPWSDFRRTGGRPEPLASWKFNVGRYDYTTGRDAPVITSSSRLLKPSFHAYEHYETLVFERLTECD